MLTSLSPLSALSTLLDLALPRTCIGCSAPGTALCQRCAPVEVAAHPVGRGALSVHAAGRYEATLRTAVIAYKERGRRDLEQPLAQLLAAAMQAGLDAGAVVVVPVPSARAAIRRRGSDQVRRLAVAACRAQRHEVRSVQRHEVCSVQRHEVCSVLRLDRPVADSAGLSAVDRFRNVSGAMSALPPTDGRSALVVDDIVTTGATAAEATRALRAAGWQVCGAAVVAWTPPSGSVRACKGQ